MEGTNEVTIDFYVNYKNKIQEQLNQLDQSQLIELFSMIQFDIPNVQYSKNKNGYFLDIKQLSNNLIEKIHEKANLFISQSVPQIN
jgi:hypothetical protein